MTLRLSSLFEIYIKRILNKYHASKKRLKKKNRNGISRKTKNLNSKSYNGFSDSSDEDYYNENKQTKSTTKRKNRVNTCLLSSSELGNRTAETDSCSLNDTTNSDESSKDINKHQNQGIDSEDSYSPRASTSKTKISRCRKNTNTKNKSTDISQSNGILHKTNSSETESSESENKYKKLRKVRGKADIRQKKTSTNINGSEQKHEIFYTTNENSHMSLRSASNQHENEDFSKNLNCRPTRLNSRKCYMEKRKSDEDCSQEVMQFTILY